MLKMIVSCHKTSGSYFQRNCHACAYTGQALGGRIMFVSTHRHVRPRAHEGVGHGVDELSAHSEITQLDLTAGVHQDV